MSWRFRRSFTVVPGLKLNLSKRGLSASIGSAPFTMNIGQEGLTETLSIPGTGLSYRHHESVSPNIPPSNPIPIYPSEQQPSFVNPAPIEQVHSASTELLTSETLKDLKRLIQNASQQRDEISRDLDNALTEKVEAVDRYEKWEKGFFFKRLLKNAFEKRKADAETATAKVSELEEQLRLSTIATHIEIAKEQADFYYRLKDEFAALCECGSIWDVKTRQATDKFHDRTTANLRVGRELVKFNLGKCDLIQWDEKVPHIQNAKGGSFYLYPGFILYRTAREAFSAIEYHDVQGEASMLAFQEEDPVPSDSKIIGQTWAKSNKDGSRDRRFANNYQIPIAEYAQVSLKSDSGLWEEFHFSNPQRVINFINELNRFTTSFEAVSKQ
ncbi:DUF4236 domain-containing protein [Edaphobacter modestus]|uniref:Uncharacterized protein DUF4236 n=1 Tax=Edaphobacter modestus TaxID=388466 RepID=A0A4Q7Y043_9BACT|nr:DUF4236 domain-containing protein [Edaphobacter modestus]RZU28899.1 uncharacterized protein DUF4236 [Edaphobacter modestus]